MKKKVRFAALVGIIGLSCLSVNKAIAGPPHFCIANEACVISADCGPRGTGYGGICSHNHCICE